MPALRYMAWNIAHGRGPEDLPHETSETSRNFRLHRSDADSRARLDAVAAFIAKQNPDIVALNEVDFRSGGDLTTWSFGVDQADHLGAALGLPHVFKGMKWNYRASTVYGALKGAGGHQPDEIFARVEEILRRRNGGMGHLWAGLSPDKELLRALLYRKNPARLIPAAAAALRRAEERFLLRWQRHKVYCGNALLSRFPIDGRTRSRIYENERDYRRRLGYGHSYIDGTVTIDGRPLRVLHTHCDDGAAARRGQIRELATRLNERAAAAILSGDFNENPGGPAIQSLARAGLQIIRDETPTYSTRNPSEILDYVMVRGTLKITDYAVLDTDLSDHRAIVATIALG